MSHDRADRLVRAADPHDPENVRDLRGADQALLEEIMTTTEPTSLDDLARRRARRRPLRRALLAAAVLAVGAAIGVPALLDGSGSGSAPSGQGQVVQADGGPDTIVYAAAAVEVAESNPRLLIDEPGWTATTVYGFAKDEGTIAFTNGDREIEMNWYPADSYDGYYEDRLAVSQPAPITVAGQEGVVFRYTASDLEAMLPANGSTFAMIRTNGGFADKAEVLATYSRIKAVDVDTWLAAMPPEVVLPGEAAKTADEILADVPLPPGFDRGKILENGVNDRYQFGADSIDLIVCGWLEAWAQAELVGDDTAARQAVEALRSGRTWKILDDMEAKGDYAQIVWAVADSVKIGQDPQHHLEMFGCIPPPSKPGA